MTLFAPTIIDDSIAEMPALRIAVSAEMADLESGHLVCLPAVSCELTLLSFRLPAVTAPTFIRRAAEAPSAPLRRAPTTADTPVRRGPSTESSVIRRAR